MSFQFFRSFLIDARPHGSHSRCPKGARRSVLPADKRSAKAFNWARLRQAQNNHLCIIQLEMTPNLRFISFKPLGYLLGFCLPFYLAGCAQSPQTLLATTPSFSPIEVQGTAAEWRAINRLTYGPTPSLIADIKLNGRPKEWALNQLDAARKASLERPRLPSDLVSINDSLPTIFDGARKEREARASVPSGTPINEQVVNEKRFHFHDQTEDLFYNRTQVNKAIAWRLASCSSDENEQPMLARMTEFWFNHFNIFQQKGTVRPFAGHYAINVARAHALGKFEDLVLASAKHPAMLYYLDQWLSVSPQPARGGQSPRGLNENYARELMELHTLGVNGGFSQNDVRELARLLTGWTVAPRAQDGFQFVMRLHESGHKTVMGKSFPSSAQFVGLREGEEAIRFLANHPATAQRVSRRLAEYFVADLPPKALVDLMASTFLTTGGDIYQVMKVMLNHSAFWDPENKLYRTPYDFACGCLRALNAGNDRNKWLQAFGYAAVSGHGIQNWQTPDGYAFNANTWFTPEALTRRIDFALTIARNAPERSDLYPYLSDSTSKAVMMQAPLQRMGFVLGSSELVFK